MPHEPLTKVNTAPFDKARSATAWRRYLWPEAPDGGWARQFGHNYCTFALLGLIIATCVTQSILGWTTISWAIGFVPDAVWSPADWFSTLPRQSLPVILTWGTYLFPHQGWAHMTGSIVGLFFFAGGVERLIGAYRFVLAVILSAVSSVFVFAAIDPHGVTPIGGGSMLGFSALGILLASYYRQVWLEHAKSTLAVEIAVVAAVVLWLICRRAPLLPSLLMAVMWHVVPLMIGWLGYRVAVAFGERRGERETRTWR